MSGWTWKRAAASGSPAFSLPFDNSPVDGDKAWRAIARNELDAACARHCPLRRVQPSPVTDIGRIVFADGTVLLARGRHRGDLGRVAVGAYHHSICLDAVRLSDEGIDVVVSWPHGPRISLVVVGIDQPD